MLYVFYVDTGNMMTFDMNLALESVQNLKDTIERQYQMPATHQVLLVSGGEILKSNSRVCSYSAGTDTNPIFMFSTLEMELKTPQSCLNIEPDRDLQEQVDRCLNLPPTYDTVVARAHIAQRIHDIAKDEIRVCERLVHEQHLQQQGWAAVMANMEDLTEEFRQRSENFYRCFEDHLKQRCIYLELLKNFNDDLEKLSKIPILPALMQNAEREFHGFDELYEENDSFTSKLEANVATCQKTAMSKPSSTGGRESTPEEIESEVMEQTKARGLTLLQWISAKENQKSLQCMANSCARGLGLFDEDSMNSLKNDVLHAIKSAEKEEMREIKGLGACLSGLDEIMHSAKRIVEEQSELATAFKKNLNRASDLNDRSVLPDLCVSHRSQLMVMRKNHLSIRDIRRRISKAKEELGYNLYERLRFVVYVENHMSDLDNKLLFYHRCLRRVQRHLVIIEQIHRAPSIYVSAITEVVRRKTFSSAFLRWASELACNLLIICNEEAMRRDEFTKIFDNHFLNTLFPGMDDMPPSFATEAPSIFDSSLPNLSKSDINVLSSFMPDVTSQFQLPDLGATLEFFASRSSNSKSQEKSSNSDDKPQDQSQPRSLDVISHLKEYERGFESETDTEEFEKVGQSPNDRRHMSATTSTSTNTQLLPVKPETVTTSTSTDEIVTHSIETLTEDNLGTTRLEVERLKSILAQLYGVTRNSISLLRQQLDQMRVQNQDDRIGFASQFQTITDSWNKVLHVSDNKERATIQQLTVDHELEMNDIKKCLLEREEQIQTLESAKSVMETSHVQELCQHEKDKSTLQKTVSDLTDKIKELEARVAAFDVTQEKAVNEMREKLVNEQKTQIESLRCRFKLMTNMERSPSDTSLEKIERIDMIEMTKHDTIVAALREELAQEKMVAARAEREKAHCEAVVKQQGSFTGSPSSFSSQDMFKRILEEKERQMDALRENNNVLSRENIKYQERIQALADSDINVNSQVSTLREQVETLMAERSKLEENLNIERSRMAGSVSTICESRIGMPTETSKQRSKNQKMGVSVDSCGRGEIVAVVWNHVHEHYIIANVSDILYFLHADSYEGLNLTPPSSDASPRVMLRIGRVLEKDYCHAKKGENRYKVEKGTKFYRVKVAPHTLHSDVCNKKRDKPMLPVSHSSSSQMLIDSFAQTENFEDNIARDMVDSGVVAQQRNISITEEDEPISLDERCRYISVSEEDENMLDSSQALSTSNQLQLPTETDLSEKDQDDSDEYRSLEAKDDLDIP